MQACEELVRIAHMWDTYATNHRLNPSNNKTYKRAHSDFLSGVLAGYDALDTDPPPILVIIFATGRDLLDYVEKSSDE
jgi:hypothetical protein